MTFNYQGIVHIKTKRKMHVIHNLGSQALFNMVAEFLVGNITRMTDTKSIQLFHGTPAELLNSSTDYQDHLVSHKIPLKSQQLECQDKTTNAYGATFYTTVKQEFLIEKTAKHSDYSAGLFSGDTLLAVIGFTKDVYEEILNGGRADIKWTMMLSNVATVQEVKL